MRACLAGVALVWIGFVAAARGADAPAKIAPATSAPATSAPAPVSAEVAALKGKLVRIWYDVDLTGTGKPSPLHTSYLLMLLRDAGADALHGEQILDDPFNAKLRKPDVLIFGEVTPPPRLTAEEARDPFMAAKVKQMEEGIAKYRESKPRLAREAAAAGSRVIEFADLPAALGLHVTEAQIVDALNAGARRSLQRPLPEVKFDANAFVDVIDFLRDVTGANILVNWRALEAAGVDRNTPITLELKAPLLADVLDQILAQAGGKKAKLGYEVEQAVIVISTAAESKKTNR